MSDALDEGMSALAATAARNRRLLLRLVPIAQELARSAGRGGVTVTEVRRVGIARRVLTGKEQGRDLSFLGAVMRRAGLVNTGATRRSDLKKTHGNIQTVWRSQPPKKRSAA